MFPCKRNMTHDSEKRLLARPHRRPFFPSRLATMYCPSFFAEAHLILPSIDANEKEIRKFLLKLFVRSATHRAI